MDTDRAWQMLNGLLFTSHIWSNEVRLGTNFPYWSIGFEVWYYVAFGLIVFAPRRWALAAAAAALVIAGPRIAVLFPIWLLGLAGHRVCGRRPLGQRAGWIAWAGSIGLLVACKWFAGARGELYDEFAVTPERLADYGYYYAVGLLFAVNLIGFNGMAAGITSIPQYLARSVHWLGERTFSLYLFHMPLLFLIAATVPWSPTSVPMRLLVFVGTPILTLLLAEATERRKHAWRRAVTKLWDHASDIRVASG